MSAMAQALAKAGLVDKEKAMNIEKERADLREEYHNINKSIRELLRRKRALRELKEDVAAPGVKQHPAVLTTAVKHFFGMTIQNFNAKSNQLLVMDKIQEELDALEKLVYPMIKATKKLEKDWGFERAKSY